MTNRTSLTLEAMGPQSSRFVARFASGAEMALQSPSGPAGATPVEAVLAALGGCAAMDVISIMRKKRQQVTSYEVVVEGERREEHPRAFSRIEVIHRLSGRDLSPAAIEEAIRLSDTKYCSVHAMLVPAVEIASRYEIVSA